MSTPAAERGRTTVADRAVRRIAERAASQALAPGEVRATQSAASVRGRRARVGVGVTLPYPLVLGDAGESVRAHVTEHTARLTGLTVPSARVRVRELRLRSSAAAALPAPAQEASAAAQGGRRVRRPWSQRRIPVAVAALAVAGLCGLLLYDVLSVHAAGRTPARWRTSTLDWLSGHGPDSGLWPGAVSALAVFALGVWLLVLALTPGRRRRLPMREPLPGVRAVLDRDAVAALLRDAVSGLPGVTHVRVDVGRRRARVRAGLTFGELDVKRDELTEAAERALADCGLARPPRLRVRLRAEPDWRAPGPPDAGGAVVGAPRPDAGASAPLPGADIGAAKPGPDNAAPHPAPDGPAPQPNPAPAPERSTD
ncbi:hypothetical protein IPZ68_15030 [Streptomyces arenae]|nr:hypothetical protein [Streptomyces arenae]